MESEKIKTRTRVNWHIFTSVDTNRKIDNPYWLTWAVCDQSYDIRMSQVPSHQIRWPARIYYDGACPVCRASAASIQSRDKHQRLRLVDIATEEFSPQIEGITPVGVRQELHVKLAGGQILVGIDALFVIAEALPSLAILRWLGWLPGVRFLGRPFYRWFAAHRYALTGSCFRSH